MKLKRILKKAFLPNGYPQSVSNDYLEYQCWDSIQAFCSSIMNNLATQALFKGVGVGDSSATVLAATITWILKDGTSIIGSLIFATIQCTQMDSNCKHWRLFADLINDLAILIDLLSPIFIGHYFTIIQCCSGILRSLVGIAGGATRAALTQHQAKCNNMADVSAKDQSQERIVNLIALIFSLIFIPFVSDQPILIWTMFTVFTTGHIYSNYRAVRSVRIEVFNKKRLAIFLDNFHFNNNNSNKNLSIDSINREENVWFFYSTKHDQIFKNVHFIQQRQKQLQQTLTNNSKLIKDPMNNQFMIDYQSNHQIVIYLHSNESTPMIEALCLVFILRNMDRLSSNDRNPIEIHMKNMSKIWKKINENDWNISHVLMAETFIDNDDDDSDENCDHKKSD
ncbi:RUS family member 1 [Dermatophagoides pteronyssinus]|uniref:RUS family member 1 n=1 Tax=Dermatophagoides pteronyssinus TaxID=6956 RepID=UPI003F672F3D